MARPTEPRVTYTRDAIQLRRMIEAVQIDPTADPKWKAETISHLQAALRLFLDDSPKGAPLPTPTEAAPNGQSG